MKLTLFVLLSILIVCTEARAACTGSSPTLSAPDTGNATTNGSNLQACITAAVLGDTITVTAGVTYNAPAFGLQFPNKGAGTSFITITTSNTALLPSKLANYPNNYSFTSPSSYRITTTEAANMPKLKSVDGWPVVNFAFGSHHWKFIGLEITNTGTQTGYLVLSSTSGETQPSDFAHDIWFEKCFLHPFEETGDISVNYQNRSVEKGIGFNGHNLTVKNCAIQGFTGNDLANSFRMDTNAILYGSGEGNVDIENCLLEGQANNIWAGGGGAQVVPSNHTATMTSPTITSGSLSQSTDLAVGDLIAVRVTALSDVLNTTNDDPDGASPGAVVSGWAVGKVLTKTGNDITFDNLTSNYDHRLFRIKLSTGVTGGTFTLTYRGETTAAITVPAALTVTGASFAAGVTIASSSGTAPMVITTSTAHGLVTNDWAVLTDTRGYDYFRQVTVSDSTHYSITDTGSPAMAGGTSKKAITITTSGAHGLATNDWVSISNVGGNTNANQQWQITSTGTNTFVIPKGGNASYTSGGIVRKKGLLASNVQTALENLSSLAPADLSLVSGTAIYVSYPTYGVEVKFASSIALMIPSDFTINGTNLTGSGTVTGRIEAGATESYTQVPSAHAPSSGAAVRWEGTVPNVITVKRNIIAKHDLWFQFMGQQKGFGEMKVGKNVTFQGNIFSGQATGMIFEVKNQGGDSPWSTIDGVTFRDNLFTHTGSPIAIAPTDYTNRTIPGSNFLITNNLFLNPAVGAESTWAGNATSGGSNITITHNTIFIPNKLVFAVSGADYDGPEVSGFSQLKGWVMKDNIILQRSSFMFPFRSTTSAPYNFNDIRDCWPDMVADHNVIIDDQSLGNPSGFFTIHSNNNHPTSIAAVGFTSAPGALDYTGNYRLTTGSTYHNTASDGTDPGVNYTTLINGLGFDPFGLQLQKCNWHANPRCAQ